MVYYYILIIDYYVILSVNQISSDEDILFVGEEIFDVLIL